MTFLHEAINVYASLNGLKDTLLQDWLGPAFVIAVAVFALMFVKNRAWMQLAGFVGIAAIVGLLMFEGGSLFGDGSANSGKLSKIASNAADQIANE